MRDFFCNVCSHYVTRNGEKMCEVDDIPFAGLTEQANEFGDCAFFEERTEKEDDGVCEADDRLL